MYVDDLMNRIEKAEEEYSTEIQTTQEKLDNSNSAEQDYEILCEFMMDFSEKALSKDEQYWEPLFTDEGARMPMPESVGKQFANSLFTTKHLDLLYDLPMDVGIVSFKDDEGMYLQDMKYIQKNFIADEKDLEQTEYNTFTFKSKYSTWEDCSLHLGHYVATGSLYIGVVDESGENIATLTTCLEGYNVPKNWAFVDVNNVPKAGEIIEDTEIGKFTNNYGASGYCTYPAYSFDIDKCLEYCSNKEEFQESLKVSQNRDDAEER